MGRVTNLGLAKPDDPMFKEGITIFTPFRPSSKVDPQVGGEWQLHESDELDIDGNSWIEVLSRPQMDLWRLTFKYDPAWCLIPAPADPEENWAEYTTAELIAYFLWSEVEECQKAPGPRLAAFYELALANGWYEICEQIRVAVEDANS